MLYVIGVLVLASFVIAFFSARTWHWGYVILVEAIFLATLGFLLLAAETLRLNRQLRTQYVSLDKQVVEAKADVVGLTKGTADQTVLGRLQNLETPVKMPENAESIPSIEQLDHELLLATRIRGRVWRGVTPAGIDAATGAVKATAAQPAGLKPETVVYLFDDGPPQQPGADGAPRGAQYLGEFRVTAVTGQQATLLPVLPLDNFEKGRLAANRGPWIIYDTMPMDRQEVFKGKTEAQLKQMLPKQTVNEYIRHGTEATNDDDPARKVGFDENDDPLPPDQIGKAAKVKYQRRQRDYALEFDELSRRRVSMLVDIDAVKKDIERLTTAEDVAKKLQASRTEEKQKLTLELAGITKEKQAIEQHLTQVTAQLTKARQLLDETLRHNRQLVDELGPK